VTALDKNLSMVTIRAAGWTPEIVSGLERWGSDLRLDAEQVTMTIHSEADLPELNRYLVERHLAVYALVPNRISLEEVFIETLGKDSGL